MQKLCEDSGGHLLSINNVEEHSLLLDLMQMIMTYHRSWYPAILPLHQMSDELSSEGGSTPLLEEVDNTYYEQKQFCHLKPRNESCDQIL